MSPSKKNGVKGSQAGSSVKAISRKTMHNRSPIMPSVNKQSLREAFDQLKGEFEHLSDEGKITAESRALLRAMIMLFELLIAVFMEKRTKKNNRNSNLPSSQTDKDETSTHCATNGKGKKQNGALSGNTRAVETIQITKESSKNNFLVWRRNVVRLQDAAKGA